MSKPSPEQQRIAELERALEVAMYWLLRAHIALPQTIIASDTETRNSIGALLCNHGIGGATAKALLKRPMEAYHFELEKAVKRAAR